MKKIIIIYKWENFTDALRVWSFLMLLHVGQIQFSTWSQVDFNHSIKNTQISSNCLLYTESFMYFYSYYVLSMKENNNNHFTSLVLLLKKYTWVTFSISCQVLSFWCMICRKFTATLPCLIIITTIIVVDNMYWTPAWRRQYP